ncbi:transcriptional regulator [Bradyrhizobium sp. 145]|uniref:transcriptional regulator n=1 Tax=Bradyrhizobium sp. 145 TaxID=2782621 RepID=UPI001FF7B9DA|nr:transcriptional regulator [Bradyrhizobium sp. 145]MCK1691617.1 transcriptional regulator [Bradyrhizobium sp. 145]
MISYTIDEFCNRHKFSRSTYYKLQRVGKGPRTMPVLDCVRISEEAEREWIAAREAESRQPVAA